MKLLKKALDYMESKIFKSSTGNREMVFYEGNRYRTIYKYTFIDAWIKRKFEDEKDLNNAAKIIIERKNREDEKNTQRRRSEGIYLSKLKYWFYMTDEEVEDAIKKMIKELKDDKYIYRDYSQIIIILIQLKHHGLFEEDIHNIQSLMIDSIKRDDKVQLEDDFPISIDIKEYNDDYNDIYTLISEKRKQRNQELDKKYLLENDIFEDTTKFLDYCENNKDYYLERGSFIEYVNVESIIQLIHKSSVEGIYDIINGLDKIYYMENARDFYADDINDLNLLKRKIHEQKEKEEGKTRQYALNYFEDKLSNIIKKVGYEN